MTLPWKRLNGKKNPSLIRDSTGATVVAPSDFRDTKSKNPLNKGISKQKPSRAPAHTGTQARTSRIMTRQHINILIACEESQIECIAFRKLGFNAYSCDILKCSGHHPEWHICHNVTPFLKGKASFRTQDGKQHKLKQWHLIIAHPPCTYLCKLSSVHMVRHDIIDKTRYAKMMEARDFFFRCLNADAQFVAVENPRPMARACLPRPNAQVSPHNFGSKYSKATYYWLRNLPPLLFGAQLSEKPKCFVSCSRGKYRSRTFIEVAEAIASQWGDFVGKELQKQ